MSESTVAYGVVNFAFRWITRALCRVDDSQWDKIPLRGPYIMAVNHVNFVEIPIMYTHMLPRQMTGFVKAESFDIPFVGWVFELWDGIPVERGEADLSAVRAGLAALKAGKILVIAPEGTRTGDGRLIEGHPGIVTMALKGRVPILPVVYYGHESFWENFKRLRRTDFFVNVGRPFFLDPGAVRVTKVVRRQMADEIMFQMARLLPAKNRGFYADMEAATEKYLHFNADA
jgi:1-acyl-sn-glycerol-3-phosphate acyltransferase